MARNIKNELIQRICKKCDFYKENEEDLECEAFKKCRELIEKGKISLDDL